MKKVILEPGRCYHVYNCAAGVDPLFNDEDDRSFFMDLYRNHVSTVAETFAYCLLPDHVHFLVKIRDGVAGPYKQFAILFNAYSKGWNRRRDRRGKLFRFKLKRVEVRRDAIFRDLVRYINLNPCRHGLTRNPAHFRYCSYNATVRSSRTMINRDELIGRFGGRNQLAEAFTEQPDEFHLKKYILER